MPKRQAFFNDLASPQRQAALLIAQVGAMPTELQLVAQVAEYDETAQGLRPIRTYVIRVNGATEHRVMTLGMTVNDVSIETDHPLLYQYTSPPAAVFFRGTPKDAHALVLDIAQAHATTFQGWRSFPEYLNIEQPLATLLQSGGGLLGQMPKPFADRLIPVLEHHGLEHNVIVGEPHMKPRFADQPLSVLLMGESYFISFMFSFEEMGKA
jgi:hypothetical protein